MSYCADCDPILAAGFARCGTCGQTAYPADAEWLPDGTILAAYPAACDHWPGSTWIVDPAALVLPADWCAALAASTGAPCRARSLRGSRFCWQHDPARRVT